MDMLTHIFSPFLPGVFTVYTCNHGNGYRPINGYVDTHIFTFSTTVMGNYRPGNIFSPLLYL